MNEPELDPTFEIFWKHYAEGYDAERFSKYDIHNQKVAFYGGARIAMSLVAYFGALRGYNDWLIEDLEVLEAELDDFLEGLKIKPGFKLVE